MKTYMAHADNVERKWYVVDAEGVVLGRLASKVAAILRGSQTDGRANIIKSIQKVFLNRTVGLGPVILVVTNSCTNSLYLHHMVVWGIKKTLLLKF